MTEAKSVSGTKTFVPALAAAASALLFFSFFELKRTPAGLGAPAYPQFAVVLPAEFDFWLGHTLLVVPASVLAAFALRKPLVALMQKLAGVVDRASPRDVKLSLGMLAGLFAVVAAVLRDVVLSGVSVVDDEECVRFGGRVLATGHVYVDDSSGLLRNTFELFMTWSGTRIASMDFLGIQVAHAVATLTGLESPVFAILAAVPLIGLSVAAHERLGRRGAVVAIGLLACSPMFVLLSMTVHAHVVSRALIALGYALFALVFAKGGLKWGAALGLALGCAFVTRPPETTALLLPLLILLVVKAIKSRDARLALFGILPGSILPLAAMAAHDMALTGNPFLFGRLVLDRSVVIIRNPDPLIVRFANQFSHDGMVLILFSFGLIGIALVALGTICDAFTLATAAGVVIVFFLSLAHNDYGVHIVGPMHFSECVLPLCLLVTHGLFKVHELLKLPRLAEVIALTAVPICIASLVFAGVQLRELHAQTRGHYEIDDFLKTTTHATEASKVFVIAPHYLRIFNSVPQYRVAGSWHNGWPRPRPDLSDDLIVLTAEPDPSLLTLARASLPLSAEAARAVPIPNIPIGTKEHKDTALLAIEESALAGRMRARFPERRIFKLTVGNGLELVPIP